MKQYLDLIAAVASDALASDLVYIDCQCHHAEIRHGWTPNDYSHWRPAVEKWAHHCVFRTLYWAVHHDGRHLMHVKNYFGLSWQGPVTFVRREIKG